MIRLTVTFYLTRGGTNNEASNDSVDDFGNTPGI